MATSLARKARKAFYAKHAHLPLEQLGKPAWLFCIQSQWWPLSDWERQIEAEAIEYHRDRQPLFHGGIRGLSVGERLLPGTVTGLNPHNHSDREWKRSRVYATPVLREAERYTKDIDGTIYRVELEGEIGLDLIDVRVHALLLQSPQFKRWRKHPQARSEFYSLMSSVRLTGDSALILEVLPPEDREGS